MYIEPRAQATVSPEYPISTAGGASAALGQLSMLVRAKPGDLSENEGCRCEPFQPAGSYTGLLQQLLSQVSELAATIEALVQKISQEGSAGSKGRSSVGQLVEYAKDAYSAGKDAWGRLKETAGGIWNGVSKAYGWIKSLFS